MSATRTAPLAIRTLPLRLAARLAAASGDAGTVLLRTARAHVPLHAAAALTLLVALLVSPWTGHRPDPAGAAAFAREIGNLFALAGGLVLLHFVREAVRRERTAPVSGSLLASVAILVGRALRTHDRWAHLVHALAGLLVAVTGFAVLKGAIAVLMPFAWDDALMRLDRFLHGGRLPHEWLWPVLQRPWAVGALNLVYNLWYFVILLVFVAAGLLAGGPRGREHRRYLLAFVVLWLGAGFFVAVGFSSAGPCFWALAGHGSLYDPLMDALHRANETVPVWALGTQDMLWAGYSGEREGSMGISAFPSLHVATATLVALHLHRFGSIFRVFGWLFAALVMLGSVVLAWHYAVDGYGGAALAALVWFAAPRLVPTLR